MIDLMVPGRPGASEPAGPAWLRGLVRAATAVPAELDLARGLWRPGEHLRHRVREVMLAVEGVPVPGHLLVPKETQGATIVLARGGATADPVTHGRWVRALLERGLVVLTFDLDGHRDNPRPLRVPGLEADVPAALALARAQPEVDPARVGLIGFDLGGACALHAAARDEGVRAVVTVGSAHRLQLDDWSQVGEALGLFNPEVARSWLQGTPALVNAALRTRIRLPDPVPPGDLAAPAVIRAAAEALRHLNPLDSAAASRAPLLVVHGEWDCLTPAWQAEALRLRAGGPCEVLLMPRRNHLTLLLSRQAMAAAAEFLARRV
ncbi:MAG: alpha/beta fold hydrolase [Candidatus Sericytochromatia bacterium]|nr:alpha/beta fold hydrolase [Candidatus Sericytochromatia bacterium]